MKALMLSPRNEAVSLPADRGRKMNAAEVADIIWEGKVSPKWVLKHMRAIGFKAGRDVLFFETEARTWSGNNSGYRGTSGLFARPLRAAATEILLAPTRTTRGWS